MLKVSEIFRHTRLREDGAEFLAILSVISPKSLQHF
jgi:hypothetical protein